MGGKNAAMCEKKREYARARVRGGMSSGRTAGAVLNEIRPGGRMKSGVAG